MSLAQKVREYRYAKGWGPDELASRADISRTALYQIESGKTELPRASTLRRIALALDVPMDNLLDHEALAVFATTVYPSSGEETGRGSGSRTKGRQENEAGPALDTEARGSELDATTRRARRLPLTRQRELERKFLEVLESPMGESVAHIVEETHRLLKTSPLS